VIARVGALGLATLLAVACSSQSGPPGATPAPTLSPTFQKLVAGAAAEGALALQWTPGLHDNADELRRQADGFNKAYGLKVNVTFTPGPAPTEMTSRVLQAVQGNKPAPTDLVLGDESQILTLMKANALESVLWTTWAPNIRDPRLTTPGGTAVQMQTRLPGLTYSTRLVGDAIPHSLADLLRPSLRGRIFTSPDGTVFEHLGSPELWGLNKTLDYVRQFSGQVTDFAGCGDEVKLAYGVADVFAFDCGAGRTAQLAKKGMALGWAIPTDAAFVGYLYMGVPKTAAHPNAAKLWINYLLSRAAQDLMFEYEMADLHLLPGSHTFADVDRYTKAGVKFFELTVEFAQVQENRGLRSLRPDIQSILARAVSVR
jgi:iron(III) transport system substrate-binding protein